MTNDKQHIGSRRGLLASLAIATTILTWASAFPLIGLALQSTSPLPLASARFAIVGVFATLWLLWRRPKLQRKGDIPVFLCCGLLGIALYNAFLNAGQVTISAGATSFIVNIMPVITAILAVVALGERLPVLGWVGTATSFCGVSLIALGQPGGLQFGAGATLVLLAAACSAIYFTLQKPLVARYGPVTCSAITLTVGATALLPWLGVAAREIHVSTHPIGLSFVVLILAILPGVIGYLTWTFALGHFGAARASNFLYLVPPTTMVIAFFVRDEVPVPSTLLGGIIAIGGVVLVNISSRRSARRPSGGRVTPAKATDTQVMASPQFRKSIANE